MAVTISELSTSPLKTNDSTEHDCVPHDEEFLIELEELAKNRYNDEDSDYQSIKLKPQATPPILEGYPARHSNRGGDQYQQRGNYRGRNDGYHQRNDGYRQRNDGYRQRNDSYHQRNDSYHQRNEGRHQRNDGYQRYDQSHNHSSPSNSYRGDRSYGRTEFDQ